MTERGRISPAGSDPLWPAEVVSAEQPGIRELSNTRRFAIADVDDVPLGSIVAARGKIGADGAEIEKILAPPGPKADLYRLIARHGIDPFYHQEAHQEVARWLDDPHIDDPRLEDLEDLPFVTIDNEDSMDLDQAIFIRKLDDGGGGFEVFYALADAAFYIPVQSALFAESLRRGSSYYLPSFSVPMLPRGLSEGLISLNPKVSRRALVFLMQLDEAGVCVKTSIIRARIRSRCKLSYRQVQALYDNPNESALQDEPYRTSLELLKTLGVILIDRARSRHVVDYHRIESKLSLDPDGRFIIETRQRLEVEKYNEQISLLCNIQGAEFLLQARNFEHLQPIFRVHPAPTSESLEALRRLISRLVRVHDLDESWVWNAEAQPLDMYLRQLPRHKHPRIATAIERQAILSNQRSLFDTEPGIHYGIGAPVYARFSSPMRELVGIFTHKEALEILGAIQPGDDQRALELRDEVVHAANRSKSLQRTLDKESLLLALDRLFAEELRKEESQRRAFSGSLISMKPHLLYFLLDEPRVEVKVHLKDLEEMSGTKWRPDGIGAELVPAEGPNRSPMRLGDHFRLRVEGYDKKRRYWLLKPLLGSSDDLERRSTCAKERS